MESNIKGLVAAGHALAEDHQRAIESIKQADSAVKLAHEKFSALAAENAGLNKFIAQSCYVFDGEQDELSDAYICAIDGRMPQTPATDAFLAEIERKAIRKFINSIEHILRDKLSPYDTEEMLEAMRIFLEEQGGEQK
ncbi:TPA: hypothetical protein L1N49_003713 [Escherichia coli]|uniref:hypothetical protein n=1 Tax=Escherichia coli TaxID=562 RepID=UPI0004D342A3|nr:hypothetical protein [Escherichia coli]EJC1903694.1 hypothetical protein [Escherichia coli]KEJ74333.1 hypothetical protein AB67_2879 [Escherichia coli 5-366-08_S1_C3]KEL69864.1 hypothetical protein AB08_1946 [Escherichia coli 5-366-08_S1_C1]HBN0771568.1 hypothetical protein [Escherichia coli]HDY6420205.1 hypothetical protein [Escherichia coli]